MFKWIKSFSSSRTSGNNSPAQSAGRDIINVNILSNDPLSKQLNSAITKHEQERFTVFIIGPYLDVKEHLSTATDVTAKARRLRAYLYNKLAEDVTIEVNLGRFRHLKKIDVLDVEEMNSIQAADLIVLLPSSPGSFCLTEAITSECSKNATLSSRLIIFLDDTYKNSKGYISRVIYNQRAKDSNIRKYSLDYDDHKSVVKHVLNTIREIRRKKTREQNV